MRERERREREKQRESGESPLFWDSYSLRREKNATLLRRYAAKIAIGKSKTIKRKSTGHIPYSLFVTQNGGGRGIRTPGEVITIAFTLGRRSYAQRIEQRFLRSRQLSVPIGFLCFLSLKYHQRCVRLFFIRLS